MYGFIEGWAVVGRVGGGRSLWALCAALKKGKGEKRRNKVGDEEFVTCCDSLNLINTH